MVTNICFNINLKYNTILSSIVVLCWIPNTIFAQPADANIQRLWLDNNCMTCHAEDKKLLGPSFNAIRARYSVTPSPDLENSIIHGSKGKWGGIPKPPQPSVSSSTAQALAAWFNGKDVSLARSPPPASDTGRQIIGAISGVMEQRQQHKTGQASELAGNHAGMSSSNSSRPSEKECFQKIVAIQKQSDMYLVSQQQKTLFEGECSHHSQARSYVSAAEQAMRDMGRLQSSVQSPSRNLADDSSQRDGLKRVRYVGEVTEMCVRYRTLKVSGNSTSYEFENGCNENIKVYIKHSGSSNYGGLTSLRAGQKTESWYLNTKHTGVNYIGCRSSISNKDVHLDEQLLRCFVRE